MEREKHMSPAPSSRRNVLLLTATITPPSGVPLLARTDPALRRGDYEKALASYLPLLGNALDGIVFGENSGSDLSSLRLLAEGSRHPELVEFVSFEGLDHPPAFGRGYGEFKLIDHVVSHSRLLRQQGTATIVWKVTGRYVIRNLRHLIDRQPSSFALYCNLRNWPRRWADMYLLAWSEEGYRAVIGGMYHQLNEERLGCSPEVRFRDLVEAAAPAVAVVPRFNVTPWVEGVRGMDNGAYSTGKNALKYYARSGLCRLGFQLWI